MKIKGVFEGGGVKGIAYVGALKRIEELGFEFSSVAGSSAGAIIASLIACGYNSEELNIVLMESNFSDFNASNFINKIPLFGKAYNIGRKYGIYKSTKLEKWLDELYLRKGVEYFDDLDIDLKVVCTDVTNKKLAVFPDDLENYFNDEKVRLSKIVTMSSSIPIYFRPININNTLFADGGVVSNYPIWIYNSSNNNDKVFRFNIKELNSDSEINNVLDYLFSIIGIITTRDEEISSYEERNATTIWIGIKDIPSTKFKLTYDEKEYLKREGYDAAYNQIKI